MAKTVTHQNLQSLFGQDDLLAVSQSKSFVGMIFELLSEKEPTGQELAIFELILNLSIDHGPETPSATAVIEAAKTGKTISESLAAGILQINDVHGGAGEQAMELFYQVQGEKLKVQSLVENSLKEGKRMAGYGHRLYEDIDPRAQLILQKLQEVNLGEEYIKIAQEIEAELASQKGKKLPLNIDGAIAVVLCSFGWEPKLAKSVFIIARTPGLCGQFLNNSK
ncbi:hypothetical protein HY404_02720 [Candidatus Microgenomates bacterium]|nr:hypothetical protein [Candidatus Microgenomates bacterium]